MLVSENFKKPRFLYVVFLRYSRYLTYGVSSVVLVSLYLFRSFSTQTVQMFQRNDENTECIGFLYLKWIQIQCYIPYFVQIRPNELMLSI
jgi:hypothetical protein